MQGELGTYRVEVEPGAPLPAVGGRIATVSDMTGLRYAIAVVGIKSLRWLPSGALRVSVRGRRTVIDTVNTEVTA
jgi:hypothetical protein